MQKLVRDTMNRQMYAALFVGVGLLAAAIIIFG